MTKLWNFTRYDTLITISVLRNWNSKGQLVYKDEYAGLECPGCKRIDEMAALSKGIRLGKIRSTKLIFDSTDSFTVIRSSLLKVPPFNSSTLFSVYNFTDTVDYCERAVKHRCQKANSLRVFKSLDWQKRVKLICRSSG